MKTSLIGALLLAATSVSAQSIIIQDEARVVRVVPIVEQVRQQGRCTNTQHPSNRQRSNSNIGQSLLGAVIGGAIGSQVGGGQGREIAIASGSAVGAIWGSEQSQYESQNQQIQCDPDTIIERAVGYRVTYQYQGYQTTVVLSQDPGATVPVTITISVDQRQFPQTSSRQQQQRF